MERNLKFLKTMSVAEFKAQHNVEKIEVKRNKKVKTFADTFVPSSFIYIQHSDGCQNWKNFLALL